MRQHTPKHIIKYMLPVVMMLLAGACQGNDEGQPEANGSIPVAFTARIASSDTRAENATESKATLKERGGFGVFACYTGLHKYVDSNVHPDFMYNEHVTSDDDGATWTYSPIKYWPNGEGEVTGLTGENPHYVSFFAYAPWRDVSTPDLDQDSYPVEYCIHSFSQQGEMGNPWLTYRLHPNLAKQVDLLCARPLLDRTKPAISEKLPFVFDHALACVGDKVTVRCSAGLKSQIDNRINASITNAKVVVTSLKIDYFLTAKARLVLWNNGEPNWQTILSEAPTCTRTVTLIPNESETEAIVYSKIGNIPTEITIEDTWSGKGVYYIPVELSNYVQTATVSISYHVSSYNGSRWIDDEEKTGTAYIVLHEYNKGDNPGYKPGKHLYINVSLNPMDIALTAAIAPWVTEDPVDVEGIEE